MVNIQFVIINGFPTSGKDTFITMCGQYTPTNTLWTSTPAKRALKELGWNGNDKSPQVRKLLHEFKNISKDFGEVEEHIRSEIKYMRSYFAPDDYIVFIHSREPKEIEELKVKYNALTVLVQREVNKEELNNDSDKNVLNYNYDYTVDNFGGMLELKIKALDFVKYMKARKSNDI